MIHVSDLHYRLNWEENQEKVLNAFFKDVETQIKQLGLENILFVFSGDVVLAGGKENLYKEFLEKFGARLTQIGVIKDKIICIPGNHDVSKDYIESHFIDHNGIISQNLNEADFNSYVARNSGPLKDKFSNYEKFEAQFAKFGIGINLGGHGWDIDENISLYCLNTAVLSSGGYKEINDEQKLAVDTRGLHK